MSEATKFFENYRNSTFSRINTLLPGVIDDFDGARMVADVVLSTGVLVTEVRVVAFCSDSFYIRIPYQKGDPVLVGFAQEDIDGFIFGDKATASQKQFRLDDSFVIGGITLASTFLPDTDLDKLVIGSRRSKSKITLDDERIDINGNLYVNGKQIGVVQ